jgi:hypothetical protein
MAAMPESAFQQDAGKLSVSNLLGEPNLEGLPLNMTLAGPSKLMLRVFYTNRSSASSGTEGLESFQDVTLW